jgi:hypothetical protein
MHSTDLNHSNDDQHFVAFDCRWATASFSRIIVNSLAPIVFYARSPIEKLHPTDNQAKKRNDKSERTRDRESRDSRIRHMSRASFAQVDVRANCAATNVFLLASRALHGCLHVASDFWRSPRCESTRRRYSP